MRGLAAAAAGLRGAEARPSARPGVQIKQQGYFLSSQRPNEPVLHRVCLRWRWVRVTAALIAFAAGVSALAQPAYFLIGREAPDFALHAVAGSNVRLSEHRGDVVVLSFWSSRCSSCRAQLASLDKSLATYRSAGLQMYGINVDDDQTRAIESAHGGESVTFALLLDPAKAVSRRYEVDNLPMTLLIDRNGIVRYVLRDYSAKSEDLYLQQLRTLLNE
jgi:peroxiredoxin